MHTVLMVGLSFGAVASVVTGVLALGGYYNGFYLPLGPVIWFAFRRPRISSFDVSADTARDRSPAAE